MSIHPEVRALPDAPAPKSSEAPDGEMRLVALPGFVWDALTQIAEAEHKTPAVVLADLLRAHLTTR